jgi:hypothetical protein
MGRTIDGSANSAVVAPCVWDALVDRGVSGVTVKQIVSRYNLDFGQYPTDHGDMAVAEQLVRNELGRLQNAGDVRKDGKRGRESVWRRA